MQLQITHDRIYFTNLRNEQVVIGHPPEYADAIAGLIQFCRTYRTPNEQALDRMLMAAADKLDNKTLLQLAPVWVKGEPLEAGMVRQHGGEIIIVKKNTIAGLEPEVTLEKPKEEIKGG